MSEQHCAWCGHAEEDHSAIFGTCRSAHLEPSGVTQCPCPEYTAPERGPSLRDRAVRFATALWAWWFTGMVELLGGAEPLGFAPRTIRGWRRYLEKLEEHK